MARLSDVWRRGLRPGSPEAFGFALACIAIATAVRYAIGLLEPDIIPLPTYYPAVLFAALVGGFWAGIFAIVLGGIVAWWAFMPPHYASLPFTLEEAINLLLYAAASLVIVWGAEVYRLNVRRLAEVKQKLEAITGNAVDAIITIDTNGIIQSTNPATEKLFGHKPADLVGQSIGELMPQPYSSQHGRFIGNYLETGVRKIIGIGREVMGRRNDGSLFPIHLGVSEYIVEDKRYFTGYVRDLSALKRAETVTLQFGRIVEDSLDEIYVYDAKTLRFISVNRGARENLGYSMEEFSRLTPLDLKTDLSKEKYDTLIAPLRSGDEEYIAFEAHHRRKDGSRYPVEVHLQLSRAVDPPVFIAHVRDLTEEKQHEDTVNLLARELTHRSKNLLSIVQAIARQTMPSSKSLEDFESRFVARLMGLAASNDLLVKGNWLGAYLDDAVRAQLAYYEEQIGKQIEIDGPRLFLKSEAVQNLGLALHELSTNAAKYGALSIPEGKVAIRWLLDPPETDPRCFRMSWTERNGPLVAIPKRKGFGHVVIDRNVSSALDGKVLLEFKPEGVSWAVQIPASYVIDQAAKGAEAGSTYQGTA